MGDGASGRRSRPGLELERLEGRALMSVGSSFVSAKQIALPSPDVAGQVKTFDYTTPAGARVKITLYGPGTLAGTTVGAQGALNLVFSGTNQNSGVIARVRGGGGVAPLQSVENSSISPDSLSGVGGNPIDQINLKNFNLVDGGRINLTAGVHVLMLNSVGSNTALNLRETAESLTSAGGAATTPISGAVTATQNGETLGYYINPTTGEQTLTSVSGQFTAGLNLAPLIQTYAGTTAPLYGPPPQIPGVILSINHINGPARPASGIGGPQVFGYDSVTNALVAFDVTTGTPTLKIPNALPTAGVEAGVTLARNNGSQVVLVSNGSNVYAYNPTTGASVGHFSVATPAVQAAGLTNPTRLGTADALTVIADPTANGLGTVLPINVTASLASGQAVPAGPAFTPTRAFALSGGLSGVAGQNLLYAGGGAHFDPFQPNAFQLGLSSLSPSSGTLSEVARQAVTNQGVTSNSTANGNTGGNPNDALGSFGQSLALVSGVTTNPATGQLANKISLLSPSNAAIEGTSYLSDANRLTGLSSEFTPSIAGSALIDVQGNTTRLVANDAQGLVFNGEGNINLVKINRASDTSIVGFPFGHAAIPHRSNVSIVTSPRTVGDRSGVTVLPSLSPNGPLSLP